jgi:hypothetical protein
MTKVLKKEHCAITIANILSSIFEENGQKFPNTFDELGLRVTHKLYREFKFIEANPVQFDTICEQSLQMSAIPYIKLEG